MLILFGVGELAATYMELLDYLEIEFAFFTDNDKSKWGNCYCGRQILPPAALKNMDCYILISCTYVEEITEQLKSLGIQERLIGLEELCAFRRLPSPAGLNGSANTDRFHKTENIFFDIYTSTKWAGTEIWAANLAKEFVQRGKNVCIIAKADMDRSADDLEEIIYRAAKSGVISEIIKKIEERLPCVFISNFGRAGFFASILAKKKYPGQVKIVAVIHGDEKSCFERHMQHQNYIDAVFCVSQMIRDKIVQSYTFRGPVYFKIQSLKTDTAWTRKYENREVIRIGYAARLVKWPKRADLLPQLIKYLEKMNIKYRLQIAGSGECERSIRAFINVCGLQNRIELLGQLPKEKMNGFWKQQDIVISLSEYEGSSLALLEAMSYGCVPVVTRVSGVEEVIENDKNGYICEIGNIKGIAEKIWSLGIDYDKWSKFSRRSRRIIEECCNYDQYVRYWLDHVLMWE